MRKSNPNNHPSGGFFLLLLLILVILGAMAQSCVPTGVPSTKERAQKRIGRHLEAVARIVDVYKDLSDTSRVIVYDTLQVEGRSGQVNQSPADSVKGAELLDSLLDLAGEYYGLQHRLNHSQEKQQQLQRELGERIRQLKGQIARRYVPDTTVHYEDEQLNGTFAWRGGQLVFTYKMKPQAVPYEKSINTSIQPKVIKETGRFWEDWAFWVFIVALFALIWLIRK